MMQDQLLKIEGRIEWDKNLELFVWEFYVKKNI